MMTSVELLRHRRDTTSTDVAATALFRASETISKGLSRVPFHTPDVQIRPIPGSLGPWVLKVQFQMMSGFCQTPLPEIFKRQIRSSARWMRHNGHLPMFRLNRTHQNVSFNGCYWTLKGRFQRACAATRMRPLLFCCGEKPRHGKMLPENTFKKPCWLPVGWWFKLSTYLSNVSGFD